MSLSVCLPVCLSVYLSVCLSVDVWMSVRLSGKSSVLQVQKGGLWRTVCSEEWNNWLGVSACKQLGYTRSWLELSLLDYFFFFICMLFVCDSRFVLVPTFCSNCFPYVDTPAP